MFDKFRLKSAFRGAFNTGCDVGREYSDLKIKKNWIYRDLCRGKSNSATRFKEVIQKQLEILDRMYKLTDFGASKKGSLDLTKELIIINSKLNSLKKILNTQLAVVSDNKFDQNALRLQLKQEAEIMAKLLQSTINTYSKVSDRLGSMLFEPNEESVVVIFQFLIIFLIYMGLTNSKNWQDWNALLKGVIFSGTSTAGLKALRMFSSRF